MAGIDDLLVDGGDVNPAGKLVAQCCKFLRCTLQLRIGAAALAQLFAFGVYLGRLLVDGLDPLLQVCCVPGIRGICKRFGHAPKPFDGTAKTRLHTLSKGVGGTLHAAHAVVLRLFSHRHTAKLVLCKLLAHLCKLLRKPFLGVGHLIELANHIDVALGALIGPVLVWAFENINHMRVVVAVLIPGNEHLARVAVAEHCAERVHICVYGYNTREQVLAGGRIAAVGPAVLYRIGSAYRCAVGILCNRSWSCSYFNGWRF